MLENLVHHLDRSLRHQTSDEGWRVLRNSPEEGFSAGTLSPTGPGLLVSCVPAEFYGAIRAAMARIEAESRGAIQEPQIQAAPRTVNTLPAAERSVDDTVPSLPDGYSFVSFHGEMSRARITGETDAKDDPGRPDPDWLDTSTSIETLVAQASVAGRDWSFGWVRLAGDARASDLAGPLAEFDATALGSSGNLVRARLPGDPTLLQEIAALPEVDGLGAVPPERKLPQVLKK